MCGEKQEHVHRAVPGRGSPPHVRGKAPVVRDIVRDLGITPACAGKSPFLQQDKTPNWDHPRMCGEKQELVIVLDLFVGSPPHVRGKVSRHVPLLHSTGITPAYAGKRLKRSRSTVSPVAIVPLFPSVCNKPVVSDGSPAGRDAPLFLPAENAVPASPAYNLRSL